MGKYPGYIILLAVCLSLISCTGNRHARKSRPAGSGKSAKLSKKDMHRLVDFASQQLGVPYKWGGNTPKGFDCSGFTTYCFDHFGVQLPRTAIEQSKSGKRIRSKRAKAGDLIFFRGSDRKHRKAAHVGIVMSGKRKRIKFIHAGSHGITVSELSETYFRKRFKTIRRVRKT